MKKFIMIYNPLSGNARFKYKLDAFISAMQAYKCLIIPICTKVKEDAQLITQLTRQIQIEGILIAGGDGTVNEVVSRMYSDGVTLPIGIIPVGTSNDLSEFLGLSSNVNTCAKMFSGGNTRPIDLGRANNRYFLNVASAGLLANVAHTTRVSLKKSLGRFAYYLNGFEKLWKLRPIPIKITADNAVIEDEIFLFIAANSGRIGGFSSVAPKALVDDGKLDLIVVSRCSLPELMRIFIKLLQGTHVNEKCVTYLQAAKVTLKSSEIIESDLDGELGPMLPLDIETIYRGILLYDFPR